VTTTTTTPAAPALDPGDPGLRAEMDAVENDYPGWILHLSEQATVWCEWVSGITLRAPTPGEARHAIAVWEHEADAKSAPCDQPGCTHDRASHWDGTGACGFCGCGAYLLERAA
jgi:hypothetical protein